MRRRAAIVPMLALCVGSLLPTIQASGSKVGVGTQNPSPPVNVPAAEAAAWAPIIAWVNARHDADVAAWVAGVRAGEAARIAAEVAVRPAAALSAPVGTITGSCAAMAPAGFPAYIIQRESGGNPEAVNPSSGAYGCAQIIPGHFAPGGACYGLGYAACWSLLWAGGAGASNWSG